MLKKIRITLAILCYVMVTLLFLDFTGTLQGYFGFLAKVQFLPAVLALNVVAILFVVVLTLLFGRIYCSVICPLGVFQDIFSWLGGKGKKTKHGRFKFVKERRIPRYAILGLFIVGLATSFPAAILIAPYSAYGRIATYILSPIYKLANNGLAYMAERMDSYLFYSVEVWNKGLVALVVAIVTFVILGVFAYFKGRAYCNTICPVGTFLGFISRFAIFRPVIDKSKCIHCGMCERNCKSSCIDSKEGAFDYSRCVSCMNCIDKCSKKAISYKCRFGENTGASTTKTETLSTESVDSSRRKFLGIATVLAAGRRTCSHQGQSHPGTFQSYCSSRCQKCQKLAGPLYRLRALHFYMPQRCPPIRKRLEARRELRTRLLPPRMQPLLVRMPHRSHQQDFPCRKIFHAGGACRLAIRPVHCH